MNVVIRADASIYIGIGHVMRCLVLANKFRDNGHLVSFAIRKQNGDIISYIVKQGFDIHELVQPKIWKHPTSTDDYEAWLQVTEEEDADSFINTINEVDLVIVDHYGLNEFWEKKIKHHYHCKIMVIDDLLRKHYCNLLLDQTFGRTSKSYQSLVPEETLCLVGSEYALLNSSFSQLREKLIGLKCIPETKHRVLVSMGGIDNTNVTLCILRELSNIKNKHIGSVTVILNPESPSYENVNIIVSENKDWMVLLDFVENMAQLISEHTFAIGAAGSSSWERACLGLPSIIISLAQNQNNICKNLVNAEVAIAIELKNIKALNKSIDMLILKYEDFHNRSLKLCDGLGCNKVYFWLIKYFSLANLKKDKLDIFCRLATSDDIEIVYSWQCEPKTRRYALNPKIPEKEEHIKWMKEHLENPNNYFYIIEVPLNTKTSLAVGVVRLDRVKKGEYKISINISSRYHNQGIAKSALAFIDSIHPSITIHATVLDDNIRSKRLFSSARYEVSSDNSFVRKKLDNLYI